MSAAAELLYATMMKTPLARLRASRGADRNEDLYLDAFFDGFHDRSLKRDKPFAECLGLIACYCAGQDRAAGQP